MVSGSYNPVLCGRSSSRPAHYKEWDEVQMGKAVEACVNEGMNIRQAAFHFGVPKSTLGDRMSGRVVPCSTSGPKTSISGGGDRAGEISLKMDAQQLEGNLHQKYIL